MIRSVGGGSFCTDAVPDAQNGRVDKKGTIKWAERRGERNGRRRVDGDDDFEWAFVSLLLLLLLLMLSPSGLPDNHCGQQNHAQRDHPTL